MKYLLSIILGFLLLSWSFADEAPAPPASPEPDPLDAELEQAHESLKELDRMLRRLQALAERREQEQAEQAALLPAVPLPTGDKLPDIAPPQKPVDDPMQLGLLLLDSGRPEEALPLLQQALTQERNDHDTAWLIFRTATCLTRLGRTDEAKVLHERLVTAYADTIWAARAAWVVRSIEWFEDWNASRPVPPEGEAQEQDKENEQ